MPQFRYQALNAEGKTVGGTADADTREELTGKLEIEGLFLTSAVELGERPKAVAATAADLKTWRYRAVDVNSASHAGTSEARNLRELAERLEAQGLYLVAAVDTTATLPEQTPNVAKRSFWTRSKDHEAVKLQDLLLMTRELATSLDAGVHVIESMRNIENNTRSVGLRRAAQAVGKSVRSGQQLSQALSGHPQVFPRFYVNMVAAGETGGFLPEALRRVATYVEEQESLRSKVRSGLIYPVIMVAAAVGIVLFMMLFIVPIFAGVFSEFGQELPWTTRVLLGTSKTFIRFGLWALLASEISALWFVRRFREEEFRRKFDTFILAIPGIGTLITKVLVARLVGTLAALLSNGVPLLESLATAKRVVGNKRYEELCDRMADQVRRGEKLSRILERSPEFPHLVVNMVATGEKTGRLPEVLDKVAAYYSEDVDRALKDMFVAMEPLLMIMMALAVGLIASAVLLPIFRLGTLV